MSSAAAELCGLSTDVWAKILSLVKPEADRHAYCYTHSYAKSPEWCGEDDSTGSLHKLRLVCKGFERVFQQNPSLCSAVHLRKDLAQEDVNSLLHWLRKNGNVIEIMTATCRSQYIEAALAATRGAALRKAIVCNLSKFAVLMLSGFSTLQECHLHGADETLDLNCFRCLPKLVDLSLCQGAFCNIGSAPHLSSLQMDSATAVCGGSSSLFRSLQSLCLDNSILNKIHPHGISACTALMSLFCEKSDVTAAQQNHDHHFDLLAHTRFPPGMADLTCLTTLFFWAEDAAAGVYDMHWLSALTNLQSLHIFVDQAPADAHIILSETLGALGQLSMLNINIGKGTLDLTVSWYMLRSLQDIELTAGTLSFSESILGLAHMDQLRYVHLCNSKFADEHTLQRFATLLYYMGIRRPGVVLSCSQSWSTLKSNIHDFEAQLKQMKSVNNASSS